MKPRVLLSILLIGLGLITAFIPFKHNKKGQLNPDELLKMAQDEQYMISVDKVARYLANEDSTVLLIDLRSPEEYNVSNIPGSVNIPYKDLFHVDFSGYIDQDKVKNIFYSNGDIISNMAWTLCTRLGYKNNYVMQGGLNEWYKTVMNTSFGGERITASENALFENRMKARRLFTQVNSLPANLKNGFVEAKRKKKKKLDGGCE